MNIPIKIKFFHDISGVLYIHLPTMSLQSCDENPKLLGKSEMPNYDVISEAKRATEAEHTMSLLQALKTYPHAVGWSILFSTSLVMEGYDNALLATLYAYGPFQSTFGIEQPDGSYQITSAWQSGLMNGCLVGQILGLFATGMIVERFGYRKSIIAAMLACIAFIFIIFFAKSLPVLLVGEILIGIPWGVFQTTTTTYASEVCPVVLRPYLTTYVNLCWVMGQLIASVSTFSKRMRVRC
jgi:SP family general alpha glucoside:H+ symporter-like MFS transporter